MNIDEFVIKVALDPAGYQKGEAEVREAVVRLKVEVTKAAGEIEKKSADAAGGLSQITREALSLFGIFASAQGIKSFVQDLTVTDSALGRLAANLGATPKEFAAWGLASERMGGSAAATGQSIQGLYEKLWRMQKLGQEMPQEYWMLGAAGGVSLDRSKNIMEQIFDLSKAIQNIAGKEGRPSAYMWARSIGMDEGTVNAIIGYGEKLKRTIQEVQEKTADQKDIAAAAARQTAWEKLSQTLLDVGRKLTTNVSGGFVDAANAMDGFFSRYEKWLQKDQGQHGTGLAYGFFKWLYGKDTAVSPDAATIAASTVSVSSSSRSSMMATAIDELRNQGVPKANLKAAAAHLVGQAEAESGLNPRMTHDSGTGYGIYGARLGRRDAMLAWLRAHGYAADSAEGQMRYMAQEAMSGQYPGTRAALMGADAANFGADSYRITREFERPSFVNNRSANVAAAYRSYSDYGTAPMLPYVSSSFGGYGAGFASSLSTRQLPGGGAGSNDVHFNAPITVMTQATDAEGIARDLPDAFRRAGFAYSFNGGAH
jgi:hypothetical protein